jgi:EAL domain-containing protein (putative c-di-GMP-specific phosphodiesterase class I)
VNVNVSARDFDDPLGLERRVLSALESTGLEAGRLVLEITETAVLPDLGTLVGPLGRLREHGVRVSLDDFGTGYSSMASLKQLPLDEIKVDGSFVAGLPDSEAATRVVEGIVGMARSLGLPVVAEAVETAEQAELLSRIHCDHAQGWFFGAPMTGEQLEAWSRAERLYAALSIGAAPFTMP